MINSVFLSIGLLQAWVPGAVRDSIPGLAGDSAECTRAESEPSNGESLRNYFDGLRINFGILNGTTINTGLEDPASCTKKDVCLLMRQLDMDFYARARAGTLTDHDYDTPPMLSWHLAGTCADSTRGYKPELMVSDLHVCTKAAERNHGVKKVTETSSHKLPTGCVIIHNKDTGSKHAYMNTLETNVAAGMSYDNILEMKSEDKSKWEKLAGRVPKQVMQLCQMDRSLSESAAAYYSPYKLKPSMEGRESHSTSCSFGMMAFLARLRETRSPCARIIGYRTNSRFRNAAEALEAASKLEKTQGEQAEAAAKAIRQYVETIRHKYVLLSTIANHWCPGIWTAAKETIGATCAAPRVMAWTDDGAHLAEARQAAQAAKSTKKKSVASGRQPTDGKGFAQAGNQGVLDNLNALLAELDAVDEVAQGLLESKDSNDAYSGRSDSRGKPIKISLNHLSCEAFQDENLAAWLSSANEAPPDFFQNANVEEDL